MPSTKSLRRRIKSIKNTKQITKAMQMVAATKMRRSQLQALGQRPYLATLSAVLAAISHQFNTISHPMLEERDGKTGVLVLSSDKGLCGALNTNIFRAILKLDESIVGSPKESVQFYTVGKKGRDFLVRTGNTLEADFENPEKVNILQVMKIRKYLLASFLEKKVTKVFVLYPHFSSTLKQEPKLLQLLPIKKETLAQIIQQFEPAKEDNQELKEEEYLFEPDLSGILGFALEHVLDMELGQALLETKASEHSARMLAMQNATENAEDLLTDLTLTYNQVRQEAITKELLEIVSAGAALG